MKKTILAGAIALMLTPAPVVLMGTSSASAQAISINIGTEDRAKIKRYVVDKKVKKYPLKERRVGSRVAEDVELSEVPAEWGSSYTRYRYVVSDDDVYFVDPSTREVVYVVD